MSKLISIFSQKQCGKGITATYLANKLGYQKVAFADAIKDSFCDLFDITREFIEEWKENPECPPGFKCTIRKALMLIGDGFRDGIKTDIWYSKTIRKCKNVDSVIEDGRYVPTELDAVSEAGSFNILIYRPGFLNDIDHNSEKQIRPLLDWFIKNDIPEGLFNHKEYKDYPAGVESIHFYLINSGTTEELYKKLDNYFGE